MPIHQLYVLRKCLRLSRWLSARLQYLQCVSNGSSALAIDLYFTLSASVVTTPTITFLIAVVCAGAALVWTDNWNQRHLFDSIATSLSWKIRSRRCHVHIISFNSSISLDPMYIMYLTPGSDNEGTDKWLHALYLWPGDTHPSLYFNSAFHDDVIKWKQFPRHWPFVRGIHLSPVDSPNKGPVMRALIISLML